MELNQKEYSKSRDQFISDTIESVREYLVNGFVNDYVLFSHQMRSFNAAICSIPPQHLPAGVNRSFFYENYNSFCNDILLVFDGFIKTVDFNRFYTENYDPQIAEWIMDDEVDTHIVEISKHIEKQTKQIVIRPFFNNLVYCLLEHKIGKENYAHVNRILLGRQNG